MVRLVRNLFWLLLGIVLGVLAWRKITQVAQAYSPQGLAGRAQTGVENTAAGLRTFAATVHDLADQRERQLRRSLAENRPAIAPVAPPSRRRHRGDGRELRA